MSSRPSSAHLAALLRERRDVLVDSWERLHRERFPHLALPGEVRRDHLGEMLEALAVALETGAPAPRPGPAARHGEQRHRLGLSLEEVCAEYALLRRALLEALEHELARTGAAEGAALHEAVDGAVADAVGAWVRATDARLETQRAELQSVLDQLPAGVLVVDGAGRLVRTNPQARLLLGQPLPPGTDIRELMRQFHGAHADGRPYGEDTCPLVRSLRTGEVVRGDRVLLEAAGWAEGPRMLGISSAPLEAVDGGGRGGIAVLEDVTGQWRAEAERDRLFLLSRDMLVVSGLDGRFRRVNPACTRILGWSEEEWLATPYLELIHPDDVPLAQDAMERLARGQPITLLTVRMRHREGGFRWTSWNITPMPREGLLFCVGRDVTEETRAEVAQRLLADAGAVLASSGALDYEATVSAVARLAVPGFADWCLVDLVGAEGPLHRVEVAYADPTQAPLAAVLRRFPPTASPRAAAARALATGRTVLVREYSEADARRVAQDPEHLRAILAMGVRSLIAVPLVARGEALGALTFAATTPGRTYGPEDVALAEELGRRVALAVDNARLYRRAQETRAFLLALLQHSPFGILSSDPDGTIRFANASVERMFGWRAEELVGCTSPVLLHEPSELAARAAELRQELGRPVEAGFEALVGRARSGLPEEREWTLVRRDGTRFPGRLLVTAVQGERGELLGFVGTCEDITARKQQEEAERRRAEFEQQLLGIVSHDLRNPLNAISIGAEALLQRGGLEAQQQEAVRRIRSSAQRAGRMIRDLLDFTQARLGAGLTVQPAPLDLHAFVRLAVDEVLLLFPDREVRLEQLGDGHGDWDADRLAQLVGNLVVNALRYGRPDTPVTVRTVGEDGWVRLEVHNLGAPIPAEMLPRIFEPLQRGAALADSAGRSVGLGLYIVRQVVQAHGGSVQVRSSAEEGTTFTARLPRRPPSHAGKGT